MPSFTTIRIAALLAALAVVGFIALHQHVYTRNWSDTLEVVVYPINGDGHTTTADYIASLSDEDFEIIDRWGIREAQRHDLDLSRPFMVRLGPEIRNHPPLLSPEATPVDVLIWGIRFRYWAWRNTPDKGSLTRVRMFVMYVEGSDDQPLQHSLGMKKGLMGLVHAYATDRQTSQNNIVIAHELLHTVGATDKYGMGGTPVFPAGYAYPTRQPLYPQRSAEIMAGRIPTSKSSAYMAESLRSVIINDYTAEEINWRQTSASE
ncbi:MAG: hypothetical protein CSB44_02820 [Gammaproteobacteria bacterium]|nr:MAG: hypothetical protein CSB44_02820 [Gammaproteobacteria bacterium]PIE34997.1 MAG: hypothetical protein CSA54_06085 [Gammaproteobacteria bacterium]